MKIKTRSRKYGLIFGVFLYFWLQIFLWPVLPSWAQNPMADAGPDQDVLINEVVVFNAGGSTGSIVFYGWDFDDGTLGEGEISQHIYTQIGAYRVVLTIRDAEGNVRNDTTMITVEHGTPPVYNEQHPAYSPDGRKVAYQSDCRGNWDIWVRNTDGSGAPVAVTIDGTTDEWPYWSPDGKQIVFSSRRTGNGDIYIQNADGTGGARQLTTSNQEETQPSWSPDGRWIAYRYQDTSNAYYIYVINIDGSRNTKITNSQAHNPAWSPDGKMIAFYGGGNSYSADIYTRVVDGDGDGYPDNSGANVKITTNSASDYYPSWSPDGAKIVFSSNRTGNWSIWVKNADGTGSEEWIMIDTGDSNFYYPDWSPDGTKIACQSNRNGKDLFFAVDYRRDVTAAPAAIISSPFLNQTLSGVVEIKGTVANNVSAHDGTTLSTLSSYTLEYGAGADPAQWIEIISSTTPVANGIVGQWDTTDLSKGIYTLRLSAADGQDINSRRVKVIVEPQKLLVGGANNESCPDWSPDGTKIAYQSDISGNLDIWVKNIDGSGTPIQLTRDSAEDSRPSWSPDGRQIAYCSKRTGNGDIYIQNADGTGEARRLTTSNNNEDHQPRWSPDGQWIAYRYLNSGTSYCIYVINIDGSRNTQVSNYITHCPDWSPDGKRIVYYGSGGDIYTRVVDGNGDGYPDNTGAEVRITTHSALDYYPSWSPDGAKIAFCSNRQDGWNIWVKNADGTGSEERVTLNNENCTYWCPVWSPDGTRIAYYSDRNGNLDIYSVDYKTDATAVPAVNINFPILNQTLSGMVEIRGTAADNISAIDDTTILSALSSYVLEYGIGADPVQWIEIAHSTAPVSNGILGSLDTSGFSRGYYILRLTATDGVDTVVRKAVLGVKHPAGDSSNESYPAWSPDGTKIAYKSDIIGNLDIWVKNADGSGTPIQITNNSAEDSWPSWSPDGRQIAYCSKRTGSGDIYIQNADGTGEARRLTTINDYEETQPSWSPDGQWIAYHHSNNYIYVINVDGSRNTQVAPNYPWNPDWSPDGKRIVYHSSSDGDVYTKVVDGNGDGYPDNSGATAQITTGSTKNYYPHWSPDGSKIAFSSNRTLYKNSWAIWGKNADGTGVEEQITQNDLITIDLGLDQVYGPDWSPDGTKIAYYSNWSGNWDIYVVDYHTDATAVPAANLITPILNTTLKPNVPDTPLRIIGTACSNLSCIDNSVLSNFASFTLEYGPGENPTAWTTLHTSTAPVFNDLLFAWDLYNFPTGRYTLRLRVADTDSGVAFQQVFINVQAGNINISDITVSPDPFNPRLGEYKEILYSIDMFAEVTVRIFDSDNTLVRTVLNGVPQSPGPNTAFWDGRNSQGDIVPSGVYKFSITAIPDNPDYQTTVTWEGGVDISSSITGFTVSPTFSAISNSFCAINYTLPQPALVTLRAGTVEIFPPNGKQLCTIISSVPQMAGEHTEYWDGRDNSGVCLQPGPYRIAINAISLPDHALLVMDDTLKVSEFFLTPSAFCPSNQYATEDQRSIRIAYRLSKSARVSLKVYDSKQNLITTLFDQEQQNAGSYAVNWDGTAANGLLAQQDDYNVVIQAQDEVGNATPVQSRCVSVFY